jgi:hypothetical protein
MYLLDANVFIQSNQSHYGIDFVPGFWDWLDDGHEAKLLHSIKPIGTEIAAGSDDLTDWAAERPDLFVDMDASCAPSLAALATWATTSGRFTQTAIAQFLASADYELIAYAHAHKMTVVTMERSEPLRRSRVKIPDACIAHGVPWTTPFQMLRDESATFVLDR